MELVSCYLTWRTSYPPRRRSGSYNSLYTHIRRHRAKAYRCHVAGCNKKFATKADLIVHARYHAKGADRPHGCTKCAKAFVNKSDLAQHLLTHDAQKTHECPSCNKKFAQLRYLRAHRRRATCKGATSRAAGGVRVISVAVVAPVRRNARRCRQVGAPSGRTRCV